MKTYYCWKCKKQMPFLEEHEWQEISPLLIQEAESLKNYRRTHGCDLTTAQNNADCPAMNKFFELTGMPGVHFDVIQHHRLADWGPECKNCYHLLRTPKASRCFYCGQKTEL